MRRIVEGSTKTQKRNFDHFVDGGFCKMKMIMIILVEPFLDPFAKPEKVE